MFFLCLSDVYIGAAPQYCIGGYTVNFALFGYPERAHHLKLTESSLKHLPPPTSNYSLLLH